MKEFTSENHDSVVPSYLGDNYAKNVKCPHPVTEINENEKKNRNYGIYALTSFLLMFLFLFAGAYIKTENSAIRESFAMGFLGCAVVCLVPFAFFAFSASGSCEESKNWDAYIEDLEQLDEFFGKEDEDSFPGFAALKARVGDVLTAACGQIDAKRKLGFKLDADRDFEEMCKMHKLACKFSLADHDRGSYFPPVVK
jgi:hypothetical protein